MCGLVGMASTKPDVKHKTLLSELLVVSTFRGMHSAGVASLASDGNADIMKCVGNPFNLFDTKAYQDFSTGFKNVHIGHTRHATRGSVCYNNSHPFEYGDIIGAHNGTLMNDHELKKEITDKFGVDTDSQVLFAHMAEHGVRDTIPKTRGAWALTFFDKFDETLYFLRNDERPLWYCFDEERTTIFWASDHHMLKYILSDRHDVEVWKDEDGFGFFPVENDKLMGFDVSRPKKFGDTKPVEQIIDEKLEGAKGYQTMVSTPFVQAGSKILDGLIGRGKELAPVKKVIQLLPPPQMPSDEKIESKSTPISSNQCPTGKGSTVSPIRKPLLKLPTTSKKDSLDDSLLYGPDGGLLFEKEYNSLVSDGCLWCSDAILVEESNYVRWVINKDEQGTTKTTHVLCPACSQPESEAMDSMNWLITTYGVVTDPIISDVVAKRPALKLM